MGSVNGAGLEGQVTLDFGGLGSLGRRVVRIPVPGEAQRHVGARGSGVGMVLGTCRVERLLWQCGWGAEGPASSAP